MEEILAHRVFPLANLNAFGRKLREPVRDGTFELEHVEVAKGVRDMRRDVIAPTSQRSPIESIPGPRRLTGKSHP